METLHPTRPVLDLPPNLFRQLVYTLTGLLPPPLDDTREALDARNHAAIAKVAALLPVDANEIDLAAQCIAARAQAEDLLRLLRQHAGDTALVMRLNAQYASMVRTSLSVHARLMRVQALRHKRAAIDSTASADAWTQDIAELSMLKVAFPNARSRQEASPEGARTHSPEGARTHSPEGARTHSPEGARTQSPEGGRTHSPEGARTPSPEGARTHSPESARAPTRAEPPTDRTDKRTEEHASQNGTESHDAAFETWLSTKPWNLKPTVSGEPNQRQGMTKVIARSRSAGRQPPANGQDINARAEHGRQFDGETAPTDAVIVRRRLRTVCVAPFPPEARFGRTRA